MAPKPRLQLLSLPYRQSHQTRTSPVLARFRPSTSGRQPHVAPPQHCHYSSSNKDADLHPNPDVKAQVDPSAAGGAGAESGQGETADPSQSGVSGQEQQQSQGPNMNPLPHISEETAAISKAKGGGGGPDVGQGTPVTEVLKGDKEAEKHLPKVMKESLKKSSHSSSSSSQNTRSFSTFTRRHLAADSMSASQQQQPPPQQPPSFPRQFPANPSEQWYTSENEHEVESADPSSTSVSSIPSRADQDYPGQYHEITPEEALAIARGELPDPLVAQRDAMVKAQGGEGLKFEPPGRPLKEHRHVQKRYDDVVEQVTNMIMRDGKKSVAQRNMATILTHLRTSPAPRPPPTNNPTTARRLVPLPAHIPSYSHLPLHPTTYLTHALDSISPLIRLRSQRGLAGGGVALQIPVPLNVRQRRRQAIVWILEQCDKRAGGVSGFAKRFAEEVVGVVEGRSGVWERRGQVHGRGVAGRTNLGFVRGGSR
ncbi:MAG: hypothetical protein M1831_003638 [Alyxoria varia]|nr:MAG: hypothetical protein M1831_003638 [Alyxoria varia]